MKFFKEVLITKEFEKFRLDIFLTKNNFVSSRAKAFKLISSQSVLLNGKALKASYRLNKGDLLKIFLPSHEDQKEALSPYDCPLEIVFEDEEILVVNKPAGLVVHPGPGHEDKTLVNILFSKTKLSPGSQRFRPGLVHRLDKSASGLLILAKTKESEQELIQQFKKHEVQRNYWAIALRSPTPYSAKIESWIGRHPVHRKKFIAFREFKKGRKKAITFYQLRGQHASGISWLNCQLKTGRTHQIRVHLSFIGCPLLGDSLYGRQKLAFIKDQSIKTEIKNLNRIALHAQSLKFKHPQSEKILYFESYWPKELGFLLEKLQFIDLK